MNQCLKTSLSAIPAHGTSNKGLQGSFVPTTQRQGALKAGCCHSCSPTHPSSQTFSQLKLNVIIIRQLCNTPRGVEQLLCNRASHRVTSTLIVSHQCSGLHLPNHLDPLPRIGDTQHLRVSTLTRPHRRQLTNQSPWRLSSREWMFSNSLTLTGNPSSLYPFPFHLLTLHTQVSQLPPRLLPSRPYRRLDNLRTPPILPSLQPISAPSTH